MNRQNFDKNSVSNYPLTIDRMAEAQDDWQLPVQLLALMQPAEACILAGCESAGAAGWVRMRNENDQWEVFEVEAGSNLANYLHLVATTVSVENSDGETVAVREVRKLQWVYVGEEQSPAANSVAYADLPRARMSVAPQDDAGYKLCTGGLWWHTPTGGTSLRVQRTGGRVHLWGSVKYGLLLNTVGATTIYTGNANTVATEKGITRTTASTVPVLPAGYYPASGNVLVPMLYNSTPSFAIIDSSGQLLISQDPELGDTMAIDTWVDV